MEFRPYRGTERASLSSATEGCLLLTAALETIVFAGLMLTATHAGQGSATVATFLRLNGILVKPFALLPTSAPLIGQLAALIVYGVLCTAITGVVAWLDRRQALGY